MSILIRGMEMPEKQTTLTVFPNGYVAIYDAKDSFIGETRAVPVPPHGRLKDYDKITDQYSKWFHNSKYREYEGMYNVLQTALDNAPTIIPAEEGET